MPFPVYLDGAPAEELANAIYRPDAGDDGWCCTRAQRVAVIRAMRSLLRKHPDKVALTSGKGRAPLRIRNIAPDDDDRPPHRVFDVRALIG